MFYKLFQLVILYFVYNIIQEWWKKLVKCALSKTDSTFHLGFFKIHFLKSKPAVNAVLNDKNTELSYLNDVFNKAHGLRKTISNFKRTDEEWNILHHSLANAITEISKRDDFPILFESAFQKHMVDGDYTDITDRVDNFVQSIGRQSKN